MPREPGSVRSIDYDKAAWIVPRFGGDPVVARTSDLAHVVRVGDRVMFQIYTDEIGRRWARNVARVR